MVALSARSGVAGILDQAAGRPVEVERDDHQEADDHRGGHDGKESLAEHREVEGEQSERQRRAQQLEPSTALGTRLFSPESRTVC